ncbi:MAG: response regulator, partial [Acetobacteraceae bacterium]|nr:response regulator [Acetobacteraceae bacterium]
QEKAGFDQDVSFLSKPWRSDELAAALRSALDTAGQQAIEPRRRVLLVEDEALVRMTTADVLNDLGFDVVEANNGATALVRLDPVPDVLFTDLGLPDMDGIALIAEVRKRLPGLPVVVASGRADVPDADVVWLTKPYDGRDLRAAVEEALRAKVLAR